MVDSSAEYWRLESVGVWGAAVGWFGSIWGGIVGVFSVVASWFGGVFQRSLECYS